MSILYNKQLNYQPRLVVHVGCHSLPAFQLCGYAGLSLAIALTQALVIARGLSPLVMAAITLVAAATFFVLGIITKMLTGVEKLVYYHHMIAVLTATALLLWLLGQPLLPYMDITLLGVGAFVACGRIGCLMVGCCHGRPHRWGVCYGNAHAAAGFDPHLVGVRLFPTQLIEAIWVATAVLSGAIMVLAGWPAGSALAWYIVAYDIERFLLEFWRGDADRPYYHGFSEAQWISVGLMILVSIAELINILPWHWWHIVATLGIMVAMLVVAARHRNNSAYRLALPQHIIEIAATLDRLACSMPMVESAQMVRVETTSEGIRLSRGVIDHNTGRIYYYTFSRVGSALSDDAGSMIGRLILDLKHPTARLELVKGVQGGFHALIHPN